MSSKFETIFKLRYLPLMIFGVLFVAMSVMKYALNIEPGVFRGVSGMLTIAGWVFAVLVGGRKKEMERAAADAFNPPPTKEEVQKQHDEQVKAVIEQQRNNIAIRGVYLFFCVLITLFGVAMLIEKEYLGGAVLLLLGALFTTHSIFLLRKWILLLRALKKELSEQDEVSSNL